MFTTLSRIIKSGLLNFWRNGWLSTATVLIMTIALITWTSIFLLNVILTSVLDVLAEKVDVSVYFILDTKEPDILALKSKLESLKEVANVEYVSTDQALKIFKNRHANDDILLKSIQELDDNPLEANLNILAKDSSQYAAIDSFLNQEQFLNIISKINYTENKVVIDRLMVLDNREIDLGRIKWVVLIALFNQPDKKSALSLLQDMILSDAFDVLH